MKLKGLIARASPIIQKLSGKLPLCPWSSVISRLDLRTMAAYPPPLKIDIVSEDGRWKKLRFNNIHDVWFPSDTSISAELWSEYLCVFWPNRANGHRYLADGTSIKPGDICLDCGACEGFFVFQALEAGAEKVICAEPGNDMAECLRRTFADQIKDGRVIVENLAAGAMEGTATFSFNRQQPFGGSMKAGSNSVTVPVSTITTLCNRLGFHSVDFIKMDIEGAEIQAVEGAMPILMQHHPKLAITTYHRAFDFMALRALLLAAGYRHIRASGITERGEGVYRPVMLHAW